MADCADCVLRARGQCDFLALTLIRVALLLALTPWFWWGCVQSYMAEMIKTRQAERSSARFEEDDGLQKSNLFDGLLAASEEELASGQTSGALSQRELIG